eukprot:1852494-Pleurochrysis_carterae.AAC.8
MGGDNNSSKKTEFKKTKKRASASYSGFRNDLHSLVREMERLEVAWRFYSDILLMTTRRNAYTTKS